MHRFLKTLHGIGHAMLPSRDDAQVIPCVGQCVGIAGAGASCLCEAVFGISEFVLLQLRAANSIKSFRALRLIAKCALEQGASLLVVTLLKEHRAKRQIISAEARRGCAWERQCLSHAFVNS